MASMGLVIWPLYFYFDHPGPSGNENVDDDTEEPKNHKHKLSYLKLLSMPLILLCCLLQISSGMVGSWYLSSLQSHLVDTIKLNTDLVGLVYMCPSMVYMVLTTIIGNILDKVQPSARFIFLFIGVVASILGYVFLGPTSILSTYQSHVAFTVPGKDILYTP